MCRDQRDDRRDVICDSFAMIKASHEGDDKAFTAMLKMADLKSCCEFLAQVYEDLIGHVADDLGAEPRGSDRAHAGTATAGVVTWGL